MPSGLSKAGFRPTPTMRDLKVRLFSRSELPPNSNMTKEHVERVCGAKIPPSLWDQKQFRHWLLSLHPQVEWQERIEYLSQLLLDRLEVSITHADDKVIVNLAKIIPELAGKVKKATDKVSSTDHLNQLTEAELLKIIDAAGTNKS
jgi:hypothetical protein